MVTPIFLLSISISFLIPFFLPSPYQPYPPSQSPKNPKNPDPKPTKKPPTDHWSPTTDTESNAPVPRYPLPRMLRLFSPRKATRGWDANLCKSHSWALPYRGRRSTKHEAHTYANFAEISVQTLASPTQEAQAPTPNHMLVGKFHPYFYKWDPTKNGAHALTKEPKREKI